MTRELRGSSFVEAEAYLLAVFEACTEEFGLVVVTTVEPAERRALRERLIASGAQVTVMVPSVEAVVAAPRGGRRGLVLWFEADEADEAVDDARWRELAVALNRSREPLRTNHRFLWVLAGPFSLRRIMTLHAQDIYSGAYKVPHVLAHTRAELNWLHLASPVLGRMRARGHEFWRYIESPFLPDLLRELDAFEAGPDLVLVGGDLGLGEQFARFIDRLLAALAPRAAQPRVLVVPDGLGAIAALDLDEIGMASGRCHVRSRVTTESRDWSVVVEKDDLRVGIVGLDDAGSGVVRERFASALGQGGLARLESVHRCLVLTQRPTREPIDEAEVLTGLAFFDEGAFVRGERSGYSLGRIRREGGIESRTRFLVPIVGSLGWTFDASAPAAPVVVATSPDSRFDDQIARYMARLAARYEFAPMLGFGSVRFRFRMEDLYVPLDAVVLAGAHVPERVQIERAFEVSRTFGRRGIVLLGDPGSGKSMSSRFMLLQILEHGPESVGLPTGTIPVASSGKDWRGEGLYEFIEAQLLDPLHDLDRDFAARLCERGKVLFVFDGLDEVESDARVGLARQIEAVLEAMPDSFALVSCRYSAYVSDLELGPRFLELHLRPLDDAQMRAFVHKWYARVELSLGLDPGPAMQRADDLLVELESRSFAAVPRMYELAHTPSLLTILCTVHHDRGRIPMARAVLYRECIDVLLARGSERSDVVDLFEHLQTIAAWMHEHHRTQASKAELLESLADPRDPNFDAGSVLEILRDEIGILTGASVDGFGFLNLGFQEFLTARRIRDRGRIDPAVFEMLASRFDDGWWREVILLLLGFRDPSVFEPFMRSLLGLPRFVEWWDTEMMQLCMHEAAVVSSAPFVMFLRFAHESGVFDQRQLAAAKLLDRVMPEELDKIADELRVHPTASVRTWWATRGQDVSPSAREAIRAPRGGIELLFIPGGRFSMGSPASEGGRSEDEGPQHEVELAGFYLARTPVTNAQYGEYLAANPDMPEPEFWADRRYDRPSQPVVGVSWTDALRYCEWAGLALPTEAQWEYACRAGTTTRHWSGDAEDDLARVAWYAANAQGQLHEVGEKRFNAFGLFDTHGNVLEWCLDAFVGYSEPPRCGDGLRRAPVGSEGRIHRGGSWMSPAAEARSAARGHAHPDYRLAYLGFRPAMKRP